jgi:hypothetical protein
MPGWPASTGACSGWRLPGRPSTSTPGAEGREKKRGHERESPRPPTSLLFSSAILGGSALAVLPALVTDPASAYRLIGASLAAASSFFVNFLVQQALLMSAFRLLWPCAVPLSTLLRKLRILPTPPGPRGAVLSTPHVSLRAGRELGAVAGAVFLAASAYGTVAPLATPFAALWCAVSWIVWRYQLLYVFERAYEAGGAIFFDAAAGLAATLAAHAFFTGCVLAACGAYTAGGVLAVGGPVGVWRWHR